MNIVALDPGRDKCGFAALSKNGEILFQKIIATDDLEQEFLAAKDKFSFDIVVIGNGTTSKNARSRIENAFKGLKIEIVDEYKTTEMARKEYFRLNPPKGWRRFIPITMQTPPVFVDDYAAVILARRYLNKICDTKQD